VSQSEFGFPVEMAPYEKYYKHLDMIFANDWHWILGVNASVSHASPALNRTAMLHDDHGWIAIAKHKGSVATGCSEWNGISACRANM
jgi:hypothetical protein